MTLAVLASFSRKWVLICGALLVALGQLSSAGAAPQLKQVTIDGTAFSYQEQGDGAPVVFIHGCCSDLRSWEGQREAIASKRRFIAFNLRYHGNSPWPDDGSKYSIKTHVDDVAGFIKALNAGPVDIVGWSYSGPIVFLVALQHPELVRSLMVYEPGAGGYISDAAALKAAADDRQAMLSPAIAASKAGDLASVAKLVPAGVNNQPDTFETLPPDVRSMFLDNARTVRLLLTSPPPPPLTCDQLGQIKVPTLISQGEMTRATFRIAAEGASNCVPGAKLVVIPNGRHLGMVQQPEAFNSAMLQFLSAVGSK